MHDKPWLWQDIISRPKIRTTLEYRNPNRECFCVGRSPGERLCPCEKRMQNNEACWANRTKPRIRVKAISVPA